MAPLSEVGPCNARVVAAMVLANLLAVLASWRTVQPITC
jgi:hypothetical protein